MKHGKITHNLYVSEAEYLELKKNYPTGIYTVTENTAWFTVTIQDLDALSGEKNFCIEIVFWRSQ